MEFVAGVVIGIIIGAVLSRYAAKKWPEIDAKIGEKLDK